MSDDECEAKISGLFKRAYDQDVAEDKHAKAHQHVDKNTNFLL